MEEIEQLRRLAAWYREFAERAGATWVWEARLRRADELADEATRLEKRLIETGRLARET
jgi:hypothetical protein